MCRAIRPSISLRFRKFLIVSASCAPWPPLQHPLRQVLRPGPIVTATCAQASNSDDPFCFRPYAGFAFSASDCYTTTIPTTVGRRQISHHCCSTSFSYRLQTIRPVTIIGSAQRRQPSALLHKPDRRSPSHHASTLPHSKNKDDSQRVTAAPHPPRPAAHETPPRTRPAPQPQSPRANRPSEPDNNAGCAMSAACLR